MKDLENIGWQQMSEILDKEMPTKKKRRIAVYWWIGAAAIFLVTMLWLPSISTTEAPSVAENNIEIQKPKESDPISKELIASESDNSISPTTNETIIANSRNSTVINPIRQSTTQSHITKSTFPIKVLKEDSFKFPTERTISATQNTIPSNESLEAELLVNKPLQELPIRELVNTTQNTIESLMLEPLSANVPMAQLGENIKLKVPRIDINSPKAIQYGLHVSYNIGKSITEYSELGIGLDARYRLHAHWNLFSSIEFNKRNELFQNLSSTDQELADAILGNNGSFGTIGAANRSLDELKEFHKGQLTLAIGAEYQLKPQWLIQGSIIPSYSIINSNDFNEWFFSPLINSQLVNFDGFNAPQKWNMHLGFGIGYSLSDAIVVGLDYNYLLTRKGKDTLINPNLESDEWTIKMTYLLD